MNPSIFNRDIKIHNVAAARRPLIRNGYLLLASLVTVITFVLLSGNPEQANALQSIDLPPASLEENIAEVLAPTSAGPLEALAIPELKSQELQTAKLQLPKQQLKVSTDSSAAAATAEKDPATAGTSNNWHTVTVKSGDSLSSIFSRLDIPARQLHDLLQQGGATHNLKKILPGQTLRLQTSAGHDLLRLSYPIDKLSTLDISRKGDEFEISTTHRTPERRKVTASATINSSLFMAGLHAGISDNITMELAGIFGWDIDFALDIRKGDQFTVIYEEIYLDGERIGNGNILAAEFVSQGKHYQAVRYTDGGGRTDFYSLDGKSMRKTFLRTPVEFTRISSRFSSGRKHPLLNKIRAHKGVDYAAPTGTPIKSTGNGKIIHIGRKGGYGNAIVIQHGSRYSTLYGHLSKFRGGLKKGSRVKQGQIIGYVGSTGLATGPHLHYELRVDGTHRDPLRVKLPGADPLNKKYMADFSAKAQALIAQINQERDVQVASTR